MFVFRRGFCPTGLAALGLLHLVVPTRGEVVFEFLRQPVDAAAYRCAPWPVFSAEVRAAENGQALPVRYQWQRGNLLFPGVVSIPDATNSTCVPEYIPFELNFYQCVVSAGSTSAVSATARFDYIQMCRPINITTLSASVALKRLHLRFDAPMNSLEAVEPTNYTLEMAAGGRLPIIDANLLDSQTVELLLDPMGPPLQVGTEYVLHADNVHVQLMSDCLCTPYPTPTPPPVRFVARDSQIQFVQQPVDRTIVQNDSTSFQVAISTNDGMGNPLPPARYQWQTTRANLNDWTNLPGATNADYTTPSIANCASMTPWLYRCMVEAGDFASVSQIGRLFVIADCSPPSIASVAGDPINDQLTIVFDRVMSATAISDPFIYLLTKTQGSDSQILLLVARQNDGRRVVFDLEPGLLEPETDYVLATEGLQDLSDPECGCAFMPETQFAFRSGGYDCVRITEQPASRTSQVGCPVTFEAHVRRIGNSTPTRLTYHWYRDNQPLVGATNRTFVLPSAVLADNGARFHFTVQLPSRCSPAISSNATLSVLAGVSPLILAEARPGLAPNSVRLRFVSGCGSPDDRLDRGLAMDRANYAISGGLEVLAAEVDCASATVELTISIPTPGLTFTVTATGLKDMLGNQIGAGNSATFSRTASAPVPMGTLRATTESRQMLLEWVSPGILQEAPQPTGPWSNVVTPAGYYLVSLGLNPCGAQAPPTASFFRVAWLAP